MWNTLRDNPEVLYGAGVALLVVLLLTPAVGGMARWLGVVDRPEQERRVHVRPVPRLGGLALFFGVLVPALAFLDIEGEMRGLLLGAAVATSVGAIDDFRGLAWWQKLGGQVAAAAIPTMFGIWVQRFTFPVLGVQELEAWLGVPLTIAWIVALMNMVNFLDGLDGLAAGLGHHGRLPPPESGQDPLLDLLAGAVEPLKHSYLATPWMKLNRHRVGWLALLFGGALFTIWAMHSYNQTLESFGRIAWFVPLVISTGGNSGSQSATLMIRALTTKEISAGDWWKVVCRELVIGLLLGACLGTIGFVAGCFLAPSPADAIVLPITIILVVTSGTILGSLLPLLFDSLGFDPALMSTPFIAGISDLVGIVVYLNVAIFFLSV
jgi:cation transporter-like permease